MIISKEVDDAIMEAFEVFHQYGEEWCRTHPEEMKEIEKSVKKIREEQMKEREINNKKEKEVMTQKVREQDIERYKEDQLIEDTANTILKLLTERHFTVNIALFILEKAENEIKRATNSTKLGSPLVCQPVSMFASYDKEAVIKEINRRKKKKH